MANVVVILDENGRVIAVEKRDAPVWRSAKVILDSVGDARAFVRGDVRSDRSLAKRSLELSDRRRYADEIRASPVFTDEEKEEAYALLSGRVFAFDYFSSEVRPAGAPVGPVNGGPTGGALVNGVKDP